MFSVLWRIGQDMMAKSEKDAAKREADAAAAAKGKKPAKEELVDRSKTK